MSMFDLKGGSSGNNWNYSDKGKEGYSEYIDGTVIELSNPQSINYATKQPEVWKDGNPKRNFRVILFTTDGSEKAFTFSPKSKAAEAFLTALDPDGTKAHVSLEEVLGKMVRIQTQDGVYNQAHPRPWWVTVYGDGDVNKVRGVIDLSAQQPQQAPRQQPPAPAPMPQQAPAPAPMYQQAPAPQAPAQNIPPQVQFAYNQAAQAQGYSPVDEQVPYNDQDVAW